MIGCVSVKNDHISFAYTTYGELGVSVEAYKRKILSHAMPFGLHSSQPIVHGSKLERQTSEVLRAGSAVSGDTARYFKLKS